MPAQGTAGDEEDDDDDNESNIGSEVEDQATSPDETAAALPGAGGRPQPHRRRQR